MTNLKTVNVPYLGKDPVLQDTQLTAWVMSMYQAVSLQTR